MPDPVLTTELAGLSLDSPVLLAAGTAGTLDEMADVTNLARVGGVVTKSITAEPRQGNETWRILESHAGMLNAIGLANVGVEAFCADHLPRAKAMPCPVVVSVAGGSVDDYAETARRLADAGAGAIELNVSCPNVHGGTQFGADPDALAGVVRAVRERVGDLSLIVKLSPITLGTPVTIVDMARAAIDAGIAAGTGALTIANTVPAMEIDVDSRRPRLANVTGGLSGPGIHPIAVKLVHDAYTGVARDAGVPIVGCGGVSSWKDAAEFILAGAAAVQIGTASFFDASTAAKIAKGLSRWARAQGVGRLSDLTGAVRTGSER